MVLRPYYAISGTDQGPAGTAGGSTGAATSEAGRGPPSAHGSAPYNCCRAVPANLHVVPCRIRECA
eukprot:2943552-Rhodomonas_salina.1